MEARERGRALRRAGWSVPDIARETGVARSTAWLWVRDIPLDAARVAEGGARRAAAIRASWQRRQEATDEERRRVQSEAGSIVRHADGADLVRIGALMYWCEGAKSKPWSGSSERVSFTNSDPGLVLLFRRFLAVLDVPPEQIRYRVSIHESADIAAAVGWWAELVGESAARFQPTAVKRAKPVTVRHNTGEGYRGCLVMSVLRSRRLYWLIEGIVIAAVARWAGPAAPEYSVASERPIGYAYPAFGGGVIGNTFGFGPNIPGSSPGRRAFPFLPDHPFRSALPGRIDPSHVVTMAPFTQADAEGVRVRTVIVLAAGMGKRMKSDLPKVLHPVLGRTLVGHVLATVSEAFGSDARTVVVVGNGAERVTAHVAEIAPEAGVALQAEQRGTGHAVRIALESAKVGDGRVIVLNGDIPMLTAATLRALEALHVEGAAATMLTAEVDDPTGLGRIVRDGAGGVARIVEHRDASPDELAIREINAGAYVFEAASLRESLAKVSSHNDQGEEYLTDVVALLVDSGQPVRAYRTDDADETLGSNDRVELAALRARMRDRVNAGWMRSGVSIIDPATTWIDVTARIEADAVIEPNTHLRGASTVGTGAVVGPDTSLIDSQVAARAVVLRTHAQGARVGEAATVGPFAYLRPGTVVGKKSKIGTFVETKNAELGEGAKIPHLSYIGDATVGEHSNVGAASVTVNYDGVSKHRTVIGAHARTGADNMFVAPVEVGDGAYTAAGSVIVNDVPPGALGVARGKQRNIDGWVARRRPGTAAADAAARASGEGADDVQGAASGDVRGGDGAGDDAGRR
jgi:bifunctional UDP-N-acetylglucosamine pyrophosphorylase/glucosamine-1-phosphate N-acetyltransferase